MTKRKFERRKLDETYYEICMSGDVDRLKEFIKENDYDINYNINVN